MLGSEASRCYVKPWQCSHDAPMCGIGRHSQRGSGKSRYLGAGGGRRMPTMSCSTATPTMMEHQSDSSDRDRRIEMTTRARPPFDVELESALDAAPAFFTTLQPDSIAEFRAATARSSSSLDEVIAGRPVQVTDHPVTGHGGGEIVVTVLRRSGHEGAAGPGVYLIHGGGMVGGSRWAVAPMLVEWALEYGAVAAAVDYRLAPEFPDPVPVCGAAVRSAFQNRCSGTMSTTDNAEPLTTSCMNIDEQRWCPPKARARSAEWGKQVNQNGFSDHFPISWRLPRSTPLPYPVLSRPDFCHRFSMGSRPRKDR